jgi:hypothetical protein
MRKIALLAAASALSLVAMGGWIIASMQTQPDAPTKVGIDPFQIMAHAHDLPVEHVVDFSVVFE